MGKQETSITLKRYPDKKLASLPDGPSKEQKEYQKLLSICTVLNQTENSPVALVELKQCHLLQNSYQSLPEERWFGRWIQGLIKLNNSYR